MTTKYLSIVILILVGIVTVACGSASAQDEQNSQPAEKAVAEQQADEHADDGDEHAADEEHADDGDEHAADEEHHEGDHEHAEAPAEFEGLTNPLAENSEAATAGQEIFAQSCAVCHGETGQGDGPAAKTLDPAPVNLADPAMMGSVDDGYLYWRISEGGQMEPFNSAMPAWADGLSDQQIWQVITYLRTLNE